MLWLAMAIIATGTPVHADGDPKAAKSAKSPVTVHYEGTMPCAPSSMNRNLAPDRYPTNVVKILRTTNKAQTNSYVPVVFTMNNNNPFNVIRMLHKPVQEEEGLLFTFVNPDNASGKVLYCVPEYMIPSLKKLVESLDIAKLTTSSGETKVVRKLKHRRADVSDQAFLSTALSFLTGDDTRFIADPPVNALFYADPATGTANLDSQLDSNLDVPTPMVQLMVKIYELDANNDGKLGLDYEAWKNSEGQDLFSFGAYDTYASAQGAGHATSNGYNGTYRLQMSSEFFDFLQSKGKARVLNQVKLAALNNRPASLSAGDEVLYYAVSTSENSSRTVTGTTKKVDENGDLTAVETGLKLKFTPTIGDLALNVKSVLLDMDLSWSDYTAFDSTGFPQINPRSVTTKMRLGVGEEAVIGGIRRQEHVSKTEKMPFLGSLPVIGYVFGGETATNKITDMVVAVQPIGIMDYKLAADDQSVVDMFPVDKASPLPATTAGYDQWLLDPALGVGVEPIK
jgi:type II secretory pathway component GspD/PulD (secretin)